MDQRLKQRLVGAGVLVLLVVWLLPELLEPESDALPGEVSVEPPGEFSSRIVPLEETVSARGTGSSEGSSTATSATTVSPGESEVEASISDAVVTVAALDAEPVFQPEPAAGGIPVPRPKPREWVRPANGERLGLTVWAIQLGSFGQSQNAIGLRDQLRERGYAAFVQTAYGEQGAVTRVFVGPELYREKAQAVRERLKQETTLDGLVVRYPGG